MVSIIKEQFYNLITNLGYQVADNRNNHLNFPWLLIRLNGHNRHQSVGIRYDEIIFSIDIFSLYNGEKEILEIVENIGNNIQELKNENDNIIFIEQYSCKIFDDNKTGPIRKHGVVSYRITCATEYWELENDE